MPRLAFFLVLVALALPARTAHAQQPVCAPPSPGEAMLVSCRLWAAEPALRFLDDFTVDHLFKPALPSFERTWLQVASTFASANIKEKQAFRDLAKQLDPLRFTRLDRTTGTVASDLAASSRHVEAEALAYGEGVRVSVDLPEAVEGGYWRGPDVLEVAFWKNRRARIRVAVAGTTVVDGEIACLSLTADGLLVRFADAAAAPVFVATRDCVQ